MAACHVLNTGEVSGTSYRHLSKIPRKPIQGNEKITDSTVVKVTFKNSKTKKSTTKKYRCVVKPEVKKELTMTAEAKGVKKIAVTFNQTVDTTTTKIVVKKGAATPTISSTTFATDAQSAELLMATKLTDGTYTVEATVGEKALTADITVQDEKLTAFELVSPNLVATADTVTEATISYKAVNQSGEMMAANTPKVTCTFGKTPDANVTPAGVDKTGLITVTDIIEVQAIPGTTGTIVLVDSSTGVNLNTTVTYQSKAVAAEATVYGVYSKKTEKLIEGNLTTGAKASDYAILMRVKDQYGSDMTPDGISKSKADVSFNAAPIITDLKLGEGSTEKTKIDGKETELTYEGASAFLIDLGTKTTGGKLEKAGSLTMTIVSAGKGVIANPTITVDEAKIIKSLSITPASTVYAGEDNAMIVEAYDAAGNAITKYDDLMAANFKAEAINAGDKVKIKKNADGSATLYFNPKDNFSSPDNEKESSTATFTCTANSATSGGDYIVKPVLVTYYEHRIAKTVADKTAKTETACASGSSLTLDLTTLTYEDQYSNPVKYGDKVVKVATDSISIYLEDKDAVFVSKATSTVIVSTGTGLVSGFNDELDVDAKGEKIKFKKALKKGNATLYFRYGNENATDKKYDMKLTISATEVGDLVASDLKLVVNDGKAIFASGKSVALEKEDSTARAASDLHNYKVTANAATALVYVTGVINGKTVVIPTSQYHLVTTEIKKIGDKNENGTDKNAKTVTQTVTVVVDSASGPQELKADVSVSNIESKIVTVAANSKKGAVGSSKTANVLSGDDDLLTVIEAKDQYGNKIDTNDLKGKLAYFVELTGDDLKDFEGKTESGNKTQYYKLDVTKISGFNTAKQRSATVTYYLLDGTKLCEQEITFTLDGGRS